MLETSSCLKSTAHAQRREPGDSRDGCWLLAFALAVQPRARITPVIVIRAGWEAYWL